MFKNSKTSLIAKRMSLIVAILGINTYFSFSTFSQDSGTVQESSFYDKVLDKCAAVDHPERQIGGFDPNSAPSKTY